jgi:hypothetical protein
MTMAPLFIVMRSCVIAMAWLLVVPTASAAAEHCYLCIKASKLRSDSLYRVPRHGLTLESGLFGRNHDESYVRVVDFDRRTLTFYHFRARFDSSRRELQTLKRRVERLDMDAIEKLRRHSMQAFQERWPDGMPELINHPYRILTVFDGDRAAQAGLLFEIDSDWYATTIRTIHDLSAPLEGASPE